MPIKRLPKSKRISKSKRQIKSKLAYNRKKHIRTQRRSNKNFNKKINNKVLMGGFLGDSSCNIATVKEAGFNVGGFGSGSTAIGGLSIPESRAMIYNPNCSNSSSKYNAMVPGS